MFKRSLAAAILAAAAVPAFAVDSLHVVRVTNAGEPVLTIATNYVGLSEANYARLMSRGAKVLDHIKAGGKFKDAGAHTIVITEVATRDGKQTAGNEVTFDGLSKNEVVRVMRSMQQVYMKGITDDAAAHGKKDLWGN